MFGATSSPTASSVWKYWAPPKNKFCMWLADIGMPNGCVVCIPMVYYCSQMSMDLKLWRPRRLKMFG
jgi:hypothetical protein